MSKSKIPYRLIIAVIAGIAIAAALSLLTHELLHLMGYFPPAFKPLPEKWMVITCLVYHSVYAVIAAFFTAMIAREKARKAVMILGTKEAIMWLLGTVVLWGHTPVWFNFSKAVLGPPLAWIGGLIYKAYKKRKEG